ncbi:50S ribosomal protein L25/general stress protein Ctc [Uliginosibacterium sp. H3]|uniref:Large ribosomal subunit protein bL25 n=1 Tax=Uliginosibacterium silvisoli TaxID=3114758 RepID=A0ABU6K2D5_9RHOO|nr:50S ribosomal protein L25/general stress protein Ctc [Uliginosibacterium sp. H3]
MQFTFAATKRVEQGTGASRRLRRAGVIPGIIYGANKDAINVNFDHNELFHLLRNEKFHSSVVTADVEGSKESVILRATQWHPFRPVVLHLDFQRVDASQKLHTKVPLHFLNAEVSPGVKLEGGIVSHVLTDLDVTCLPADLPEFIEVDLKDLSGGHSLHVSQLKLPKGVEVVHHGEGDPVVATILQVRGSGTDDAAGEAAAPAA